MIPADCKAVADGAQQCAATKATKYGCSDDGLPSATAGCEDEVDALFACLVNGGSKDAGSNPGSCGAMQIGSASCNTCAESKCCTEKAACAANADCIAILECFDANNCSDGACYENCESQHPKGTSKEIAMFQCISTNCDAQCR